MAEQIKFGDRLFLKGEKVLLDNGELDAILESVNGTLVIRGNLRVEGATEHQTVQETVISDPFMLLHGEHQGAPTSDVGIEVNRDLEPNVKFGWDETEDCWTTFGSPFCTTTITANVVDVDTKIQGPLISDDVDINGGNIDGTVIGAEVPVAGTFSTITGDGTNITNVLTNYTTDDLVEGNSNLYYTDLRVDQRINELFDAGYGISATEPDADPANPSIFSVSFDTTNVGNGARVLDEDNTSQAAFRTLVSGPNLDLTVVENGDEIVIDTAVKLNMLQFQSIIGDGTDSVFGLNFNVGADWQALVYIDGVVQEPTSSYTINNGNQIVLTSPLANGSTMNILKMATNVSATEIANAQDSNTLNSQPGTYYLDYNNFTNTPILFSGNYNDLSNKPSIPTDISELTDTNNILAAGGGYPNFVSSEDLSHGSAVGGTTVTATIPAGATIAYIPWTTINSARNSGPFNVIVNGTSYFVDDMATGGDSGSTSGSLEIGLLTGTIIRGREVAAMLGTPVTSLQLYSQHNDSDRGFASVSATVYYDA